MTGTPLSRLQTRSLVRHGKRRDNAKAWLDAFERRAEALMSDRAQSRALMSHGAGHRFNDPRYAQGTSVNATDIRHSSPWKGSKAQSHEVTRIEGLPLWLTMSLDTDTIAAHWPHRVTVFEQADSGSEKAPKGKRRSKGTDPSKARAARLRSAAGTIRMAEQD